MALAACRIVQLLRRMNSIPQSFPHPEASGYGQLPLDADRPVVLVTNDDGYEAKGIQALVESLRGL